jgi:hypothetical protein
MLKKCTIDELKNCAKNKSKTPITTSRRHKNPLSGVKQLSDFAERLTINAVYNLMLFKQIIECV